MNKWFLSSWQNKPNLQKVNYKQSSSLNYFYKQISSQKNIVTISEIEKLKSLLHMANKGKAFIIQAGDCTETFASSIDSSLEMGSFLIELQHLLSQHLKIPIIPIGRIAGQFAKPRTKLFEKINNIQLPSYRGDLINSHTPSLSMRQPDPAHLLTGYIKAKNTYEKITQQFANGQTIFTSHEALHLLYEEALTKMNHGKYYNLSTHLPWLGVRTNNVEHAHIEYLRGIENPVGIKIGPKEDLKWLKKIISILNPNREKNKLVLITRLSSNKVDHKLPALIEFTQKENIPVTWLCDPMHGNTNKSPSGEKTRQCESILDEYLHTSNIHKFYNSYLAGIHLEITTEKITECDGWEYVTDLKKFPKQSPLIDPRLNINQTKKLFKSICSDF